MTEPTASELGVALAKERERRGLSVRTAASMFGVTGGAYSRWETGHSMPAFDDELLEQLADFLGVSGIDLAVLIVDSITAMNGRRASR